MSLHHFHAQRVCALANGSHALAVKERSLFGLATQHHTHHTFCRHAYAGNGIRAYQDRYALVSGVLVQDYHSIGSVRILEGHMGHLANAAALGGDAHCSLACRHAGVCHDVIVAVGRYGVIVLGVYVQRAIASGAASVQIGTAVQVEHHVPHHHSPALAAYGADDEVLHVVNQTRLQIASVIPCANACLGEDNLLVRCLLVDVVQFGRASAIVVPCRTHHQFAALHLATQGVVHLHGIILLPSHIVIVVVVVKAVYLGVESGTLEGRCHVAYQSGLVLPRQI